MAKSASNPNPNQQLAVVNYENTQLVETRTPIMMSPSLFAGAMQGNLDIIRQNETLISTRFTRTGNSVLHIASDFEQLECVKEIIKLLGNHEAAKLLKKGNNKGDTALHVAAKRGYLNIVEELVNFAAAAQDHGGDVENKVVGADGYHVTELLRTTNNKGNTALHEAARSGNKVGDSAFCNVTFINLFKEDSGVVKFLAGKDSEFEYGPNLGGETPLYIAAESRRQAAAIAILRICKSPAYQGPLGRTALHAAVISNSTVVTKEMMDKMPNLAWKKDEDDWTPLHWAAFYNHSSIVTQLLRFDKSLAYIPDDNGVIPLHVAGSRGNISAMVSLITNCPDCYDMVDKKGRNVIHHAVLNRQFGTIREIANGPLFFRLLNEGDEDGNTPFHLNPDPFLPPGFTLPLGVDIYALNANGLTIVEEVSRHHSFNQKKMIEPFVKWATNRRPRKPSSGGISRPLEESPVKRTTSAGEINSDEECKVEDERFKVEMDSHLIVAALVATVAFAAGFTAPGGYDDTTGIAKLHQTFGFQCFIVFDAFALMLSFSAILLYFNSVFHMYKNKLLAYGLVSAANLLTLLGIFSTVIAYVAAVALTTGSTGISVVIIVSGVVFFVFYFGILILVIGRFVFRGHSFWGLFYPPLGSWSFRVTLGDHHP